MDSLGDLGKTLVIAGGLAILAGLLLVALGRIPLLGHLPGDVTLRRGNASCTIPIASSLLLSLLLTLLLNLLLRLLRR
jgi:hypothetical protein